MAMVVAKILVGLRDHRSERHRQYERRQQKPVLDVVHELSPRIVGLRQSLRCRAERRRLRFLSRLSAGPW